MKKPALKSVFIFKQLAGVHDTFQIAYALTGRAGEHNTIDSLLAHHPNCAAYFKIIGEDTTRFTTHYFQDKPASDSHDILGMIQDFKGLDQPFIHQVDYPRDNLWAICFFRRSRTVQLCFLESIEPIDPMTADIDEIENQLEDMLSELTLVPTNDFAISTIWNIGIELPPAA